MTCIAGSGGMTYGGLLPPVQSSNGRVDVLRLFYLWLCPLS